jgi:hypothetical protein
MSDWQREAREAIRKEAWSLRGPNQIVKVVSAEKALASRLGGYITLGKFLVNKTPAEIEAALGLRCGDLCRGARIYHFTRLPGVSEYEYEQTADLPDGLAYHPAYSDPNYLPGSKIIHQWRIKRGVEIPVDTTNYLDLKPGQIVPRSWLV